MNIDAIMARVLLLLKEQAPYRSGELVASITMNKTPTGYELRIAAPHTVFTNEPWISPRWKGRENPNEAWIQHTHRLIAEFIARELGGKIDN